MPDTNYYDFADDCLTDAEWRRGVDEVVAELRSIVEDGPATTGYGICTNLEDALIDPDTDDDTVGSVVWDAHRYNACQSWPKSGGCGSFPINDPGEAPRVRSAQYSYHSSKGTLWEGRQGELRRELAEHLLQYFLILKATGRV